MPQGTQPMLARAAASGPGPALGSKDAWRPTCQAYRAMLGRTHLDLSRARLAGAAGGA